MKPLKQIRILIEPREPGLLSPGEPNPPRRELGQYDRLAQELRAQAAMPVDIVERPLEEAPRDGMLLVAYHIGMRERLRAGSAGNPRPLLLDVGYPDALLLAESAGLAGAVIVERFARWQLKQESRIFRQIYGLKSLAPPLGPLLLPGPLAESERYCLYESRQAVALPVVLNFYIEAYWRSLSHAGI
jgi:hypothetical protein